jgi:hypothetical protein
MENKQERKAEFIAKASQSLHKVAFIINEEVAAITNKCFPELNKVDDKDGFKIYLDIISVYMEHLNKYMKNCVSKGKEE